MLRSEMIEHIQADLKELLLAKSNKSNLDTFLQKKAASILDMIEGFGMLPPYNPIGSELPEGHISLCQWTPELTPQQAMDELVKETEELGLYEQNKTILGQGLLKGLKQELKYRDPLHIPYSSLEIKYGNYNIILNKSLIDKQNCWNNVEKIKAAHLEKANIYEEIEQSDNIDYVRKVCIKKLTKIEFKLQKLWGFEKDARFHRFWETPKCQCPVLDNSDSYPYRTIINSDCPLHG